MSSQHLFFSSTPSMDKYMLFEVSEDMLRQISSGCTLLLRGQKNEHAVVCTDTQTFMQRQTQNSNSCFLLEPVPEVEHSTEESISREIVGVTTCSYDLTPTYPRIVKLDVQYKEGLYSSTYDRVLSSQYESNREIYMQQLQDTYEEDLGELRYSVAVHGDNSDTSKAFKRSMQVQSTTEGLVVNGQVHSFIQGYTYHEQKQLVQCSELELQIGLVCRGAMFVDGKYVLLDPSLLDTVLDAVIDIIGAEQQSSIQQPISLFEEILKDKLCSPAVAATVVQLCMAPEHIAEVATAMMQKKAQTTTELNHYFGTSSIYYGITYLPRTCTLHVALLAQQKARQIIQQNKDITFHKFAPLWTQSLPPRLECTLDSLRGYLIVQDPVYNPQKGYKTGSHPTETLDPSNHHSTATVVIFDENVMDLDVTKRFREIFKFQNVWTQSEISPYIIRFTDTMTVDQILVTYTRAIKVGPGNNVESKTVVYAKK